MKFDFDALSVYGNYQILEQLMPYSLLTLGTYAVLPKAKSSYALLLATSPYYIWYLANSEDSMANMKTALLRSLSRARNVFHFPSSNDHFVWALPQTISINDFITMLMDVDIYHIYCQSFGMKSSIEWGMDVMTEVRRADPDAEFAFDLAGEFGVHECPDGAELPGDSKYITLVRMDPENMAAIGFWGRPIHYMMFPQVQAQLNSFARIPCFGSVTVERVQVQEGFEDETLATPTKIKAYTKGVLMANRAFV
jgi:hypothetical protein